MEWNPVESIGLHWTSLDSTELSRIITRYLFNQEKKMTIARIEPRAYHNKDSHNITTRLQEFMVTDIMRTIYDVFFWHLGI